MITCAVKLKLRDNHDYKEAEMFEARLSFFYQAGGGYGRSNRDRVFEAKFKSS